MNIHDWHFDPERNTLRRGAETVRLEPKPAELLRVLHGHAGSVVSKEDLIRAVWGDVAVSEEVLTTAIYQIRRSLGDDRHAPRYIETVPRRGYRLLPVQKPAPPRFAAAPMLFGLAMLVCGAIGATYLHEQRVAKRSAIELHRLGASTLASGEDLNAAITMLRRASQLDRDNTDVAGSLALALTLSDRDANAAEARALVTRALSRDPGNADARIASGIAALWSDWNWTRAKADLEQAAAAHQPLARAWLALVCSMRGDVPTAVRLASNFHGPPIAVATASSALLLAGHFDEAERIAMAASQTHPSSKILARQIQKIHDRRLERAGALTSGSQFVASRPTDIARIHLGYGNAEAALSALETALRQRDEYLLYLRVDTRWDPLRAHPRFQSIVAAVGL